MVDSPLLEKPSEVDEEEEESEEDDPIGTLAILTLFLILLIGLWIAVYVTLWQRA